MKYVFLAFFLFIFAITLPGEADSSDSHFKWKNEIKGDYIEIAVEIPRNHYLYSDRTKITVTDANSRIVTPDILPETMEYKDEFGGKYIIYAPGVHIWKFPAAGELPFKVVIDFQGCRKDPYICFVPEKYESVITAEKTTIQKLTEIDSGRRKSAISPVVISQDWKRLAEKFSIIASSSGYQSPGDFLAFLEASESGQQEKSMFRAFENKNFFLSAILILLGGLALNFTPCVLPMIPVNIAIIGVRAQSGSPKKGFLLGGIYGAGIAISYGFLGIAVVLTGSTFGFLNASPWFNLWAAAIFILLSLAMFDVYTIDFSRFQKTGNAGIAPGKKAMVFQKIDFTNPEPLNREPVNLKVYNYALVFVLGAVSALLAGACVAPVVIAVLLFSVNLYSKADFLGLVLPFLLGVGMALPWPFAGAGLSFLPKPGRWMVRVKQSFGILILLFAVYYGFLSYSLFRTQKTSYSQKKDGDWFNSLQEALIAAEKEDKPVFIDFWASWCKNCTAMEEVTFKDDKVRQSLQKYVKLKFNAENPNEKFTKEVLDYFNIIGLPTYVIIKSGQNAKFEI